MRTGYLTGVEASVCDLSPKGRDCFQGSSETEKKKDQVKKMVDEAGKQSQTAAKKIKSRKKKSPKMGTAKRMCLRNTSSLNLGSGRRRAEKKKFQHRRLNHPVGRLDELKDATPQEKEKLTKAGYTSVIDLSAAPVTRLIGEIDVSLKKAAGWINQARRKTGIINE